MNFNNHYDLAGKHAFLSASSYHWTNYTTEKLKQVYTNQLNKEKGTMLHEFAATAIEQGIKLAKNSKALNMFVNDAISLAMKPEQVLYYSYNCFGTADAISYKEGPEGRFKLRIHDLKTGFSKPSFKQLDIYCALFCLEYDVNPYDIDMEQRLYQGRGYEVNIPKAEDIEFLMNRIIEFDSVLDEIKSDLN